MSTPGSAKQTAAPSSFMPTSSTTVISDADSQTRSVKRPRPVKSCVSCRARKLKCNRLCPCGQCQRSNRACKYGSMDQEAASVSDGASELDPLERPAKRVVSHRPGPQQPPPLSTQLPSPRQPTRASSNDGAPAMGSTPGWELTGNDARSGPSNPLHTTLADVSSRLERLERALLTSYSTPGVDPFSPRHRLHIAGPPPSTIRGLTVKGDAGRRTRFFGQSTTRVLLNLFEDAREFMTSRFKDEKVRDVLIRLQNVYKRLQQKHRELLTPISVYVDSIMPIKKRMEDTLPSEDVCDRLLKAYLVLSEGFFRVVHTPTFRAEYDVYWRTGRCSEDFLPRLLCMSLIGSWFFSESKGFGRTRSDAVHVPTATALVRSWLDGLRGKRMVEVSTLQVEILLLHGQRMISPRFPDLWTQMGFIVRMAMTMGLHRDPSEFPNISPFAGEERRRLWYTIMEMDLHISLSSDLPCFIREFEFTCRPPKNLNDEEVHPGMTELPSGRPLDHETDMQLQCFAARTLATRIRVSAILGRLDTIRDYDEVLELGSKLEHILDDVAYLFPRRYSSERDQTPKTWKDLVLFDAHVRGPLVHLYRPFVLGAADCPPQITTAYLKSCMSILTYVDDLDPSAPGHAGILHIYHQILKTDIILAAFSVCFFIKEANENNPEEPSQPAGPAWSTANPDPANQSGGSPWTLWSPSVMTGVVEKRLQTLVAAARDSSSELKDAIALAVVLASVQPGETPEAKRELMRESLGKVLEICTTTFGTLADRLLASSVNVTAQDEGWGFPVPGGGVYTSPGRTPFASNVVTDGAGISDELDELSLWDTSFWGPINPE